MKKRLSILLGVLLTSMLSMAATHEYVDLGLPSGTLWATCNVGASAPEGYGSYFAWGETTTKSTYSWSNYKYASGTAATAIYIGDFLPNNSKVTSIQGTQYDAAKAQWGSDWVMPSKDQVHELIQKCSVSAKTVNGVKGVQYKGPNGNTMFLPCGGFKSDATHTNKGTEGYYWSGTGDVYDLDKSRAVALYNKSSSTTTAKNIQRRTGANIRAVRASGGSTEPATADPEAVDLGLSVKWATFNVGATSKEKSGTYFAWGETAKKSSYTWANYQHASGSSTTCKSIGSDISATQYDAASKAWGDDWRMPTASEIDELLTKCTWTAATVNSVKGYTVKGPSGKTIFLPFAGCSYEGKTYGTGSYTYYWSSEVSEGATGAKAYALYPKSGTSTTKASIQRRTGAVIRPVKGDMSIPTSVLPPPAFMPELVDLGLSVRWCDQDVGSYCPGIFGGYYAWGETSTKSTYTWANYQHSNGTQATAKNIGSDISGTSYDAAYAEDEQMCLPTVEQWNELISKCTFKLVDQQQWNAQLNKYVDGKAYQVTGPNGNSILLPLSGGSYEGKENGVGTNAYYWTANNDASTAYKAKAAFLTTTSKSVTSIQRRTGAAIRPVEYTIPLPPPIMIYATESVDLGLSVDWCNTNVNGLTLKGDHFEKYFYAWGETEEKNTYTWANYEHAKGTAASVVNIGNDISATKYDVAWYTNEWIDTGDSSVEELDWRMPTIAEVNELINKCIWKEVSSPAKGYEVTGPSGNSIFIPFTGCSYEGKEYGEDSYAYIWSSGVDTSNKQKAKAMYIKSGAKTTLASIQRRTGAIVRAVCPKPKYVDLDLPSGNLWATCNVGATSAEKSGNYYAWGETETKSKYTWDNYEYDIFDGSAGSYWMIDIDDISGPYGPVARLKVSSSGASSILVYDVCLDPAYGDEISVSVSYWSNGYVSYMPNKDDFNELIKYCTKKEDTVGGVKGVRFTSSNGQSVFFPYAGSYYESSTPASGTVSYYWTSNMYNDDTKKAYAVKMKSGTATMTQCQRRTGLPIRPVYKLDSEWANGSKFDTDGINDVKASKATDQSVYTLQGVKVEGALKPGVYIRNGKKFVVK